MNIKRCGYPTVNYIHFHWHLTNWCNYKCSYCPVLTQIHSNFSQPDHAKDHRITLARLRNIETPFQVCMSGGEPTLHPEIFDILQELESIPMCDDVAVFTNLSRPVKFYEQMNELKLGKTTMSASYHVEYANDDKFLERAVAISGMEHMKVQIHVSMTDDSTKWDQIKLFMDKSLALGIKCRPTLLLSNNNWQANYTDEFFEIFMPYFEQEEEHFKTIPCTFKDDTEGTMKDYEIELKDWNRFKGWNCTPVVYQITIEGDIRNSCTQKAMPLLLSNKNIIRQEICPNDICPSRSMLRFPKYEIQ